MSFFFFVLVAARTPSPGNTNGTNTVLPSACVKPSPPYTSFSIDNSNSSDIVVILFYFNSWRMGRFDASRLPAVGRKCIRRASKKRVSCTMLFGSAFIP